MKKSLINELTREQELELVAFRERMWRQGTSCLPTDRAVAEKAIADAYAVVKRPPPKIFWMSSPMTCALALYVLGKLAEEAQKRGSSAEFRAGLGDGLWAGLGAGLGAGLWDGLGDGLRQHVRLDVYGSWWPGQMDTFWLAYYRFGSMIGCPQRESLLERLDIMERIAASCGFWFPRDGICIVSDRFASVSWDNSRNAAGMPTRLHHDTKMAASFRDGWGLYYWHGFRIPPSHEWLFADREKLNATKIDKEPNAELRRIMLEIYGFERYLGEREAKLVGSDELHGFPRNLYEVRVGGEPIRIVEVTNGSLEPDGSRRKFHLGAARSRNSQTAAKTPHEAIANSYGIHPDHYREAVRT